MNPFHDDDADMDDIYAEMLDRIKRGTASPSDWHLPKSMIQDLPLHLLRDCPPHLLPSHLRPGLSGITADFSDPRSSSDGDGEEEEEESSNTRDEDSDEEEQAEEEEGYETSTTQHGGYISSRFQQAEIDGFSEQTPDQGPPSIPDDIPDDIHGFCCCRFTYMDRARECGAYCNVMKRILPDREPNSHHVRYFQKYKRETMSEFGNGRSSLWIVANTYEIEDSEEDGKEEELEAVTIDARSSTSDLDSNQQEDSPERNAHDALPCDPQKLIPPDSQTCTICNFDFRGLNPYERVCHFNLCWSKHLQTLPSLQNRTVPKCASATRELPDVDLEALDMGLELLCPICSLDLHLMSPWEINYHTADCLEENGTTHCPICETNLLEYEDLEDRVSHFRWCRDSLGNHDTHSYDEDGYFSGEEEE